MGVLQAKDFSASGCLGAAYYLDLNQDGATKLRLFQEGLSVTNGIGIRDGRIKNVIGIP